jgi:hypothetical protein
MLSLIRISIQVALFALLTVALAACVIPFSPLRPSTPTVAPSFTPIPTLVQATQPTPSLTLIPTLVQATQPPPVFTSVSTVVQGTPPERIPFDPGATSATVRDQFTVPGRKEYILNATVGQVMEVLIDSLGSGVSLDLTIISPNGMLWTDYDSWGIGPSVKTITLPESGDYRVSLTTPADAPAMEYEAGFVIITPAAPGESPERVDFGAGTTQVHRSGALIAGGVKNYVLTARAGQLMKVQSFAIGAAASFVVTIPGGSVYPAESIPTEAWVFGATILLPESGDYLVTVSSPGDGNSTIYGITFSLEGGEPPERVDFASGETSATRTGVILAGINVKEYILGASQGQRLRVTGTTATPDDGPIGIIVTLAGTNDELGWTVDDNSLTMEIPATADYVVNLSTARAAGDTSYTVVFEIE